MSKGRDVTSEGILRFLNTLRSKDNQTIRIFQVSSGDNGTQYRTYREDAKYVAQAVHRTTSVLRYVGNEPWCVMNYAVFGNFVKDGLLKRGLKMELYNNESGSWKLAQAASPGNIQALEDILGGTIDQNPVMMAVKVHQKDGQRMVGVSFVDTVSRTIGVSEFTDNELFSNLESLVIQLSVKECALQEIKEDPDLKKIVEILDRCNVGTTQLKSSQFKTDNVEQDLRTLLGKDNDVVAELVGPLTQKLATGCAAALIEYLNLLTAVDAEEKYFYSLVQHDLSQYMRLDASALRALNLMPDGRTGAKNMSLLGLLNQCKSGAGARLLEQWLKQPLMDKQEIDKRHDLVEVFINDPSIRDTLQTDLLKAVPDVNRLNRKFQRGKAGLEDVVRIYQLVVRIPEFIATLEKVDNELVKTTYLDCLNESAKPLEVYRELVEFAVDLDALDDHKFRVNPGTSAKLLSLHETIESSRVGMEKCRAQVADDLGLPKLNLEEHKSFGVCFRVTRKEQAALKSKSGYTELATMKNGIYFQNSKLKKLSRDFKNSSIEYEKEQSSTVDEVVRVAAQYHSVLTELSTTLAHLDVIVSFAEVSATSPVPFVRPTMHPRHTGNTVLKEARHPCMEVQDEISFIPNDVNLVRDESEFLIITGPNMGGKSTYIRQIGVIALMAQAGCFVPCSEAELTIFDSILARVGAGDSQLKGLSTFMSEMLETATILRTATRESLIVIDELGRGTSTYDGFGLAWAISEHIVKDIGCFAMFATHFHELTGLGDHYKQVQNLKVCAEVNALEQVHREGSNDDYVNPSNVIALLYKVEPGVSDQSFGINVAEVVKFPQRVINMAKRKATELEDFGADDGTLAKQLKVSKEETKQGSELLRGLLTEWAQKVDLEKDDVLTARNQLKELVNGAYSTKIESSQFMKDIMHNL